VTRGKTKRPGAVGRPGKKEKGPLKRGEGPLLQETGSQAIINLIRKSLLLRKRLLRREGTGALKPDYGAKKGRMWRWRGSFYSPAFREGKFDVHRKTERI